MRAILYTLIMTATASISSASIILTFEAATVESTTVANTITETFNGVGLGGLGVFVSPIGTYSAGAKIVAPDTYGGSNASQYAAVGSQSDTTSYSLTFNAIQSYFGLYWAAGDAQNRLDFYLNNVLVQTFQISDYVGLLSAAYLGNPSNGGSDPDEKFAYINFTSNAAGTNFDKVVFRNLDGSTGFETDNHSILRATPEPSSIALMLAGLGSIVAVARRRRRSASNNI